MAGKTDVCIIMPTARLAEMQLRLSPTTLKIYPNPDLVKRCLPPPLAEVTKPTRPLY